MDRAEAPATAVAIIWLAVWPFAARVGVNRLRGRGRGRATDAKALASALGSMKGPLMKVALSTIPDALPADFAAELMRLQSQAPPMGAAFVRRRMRAELGPDWRERFGDFDFKPAARRLSRPGASRQEPGRRTARLQAAYPDVASAVETGYAPSPPGGIHLLQNSEPHAKAYAQVHNQFNQERHLVTRQVYKQRRSAALAEWRALVA